LCRRRRYMSQTNIRYGGSECDEGLMTLELFHAGSVPTLHCSWMTDMSRPLSCLALAYSQVLASGCIGTTPMNTYSGDAGAWRFKSHAPGPTI
jgi:hypothetical protein